MSDNLARRQITSGGVERFLPSPHTRDVELYSLSMNRRTDTGT